MKGSQMKYALPVGSEKESPKITHEMKIMIRQDYGFMVMVMSQ